MNRKNKQIRYVVQYGSRIDRITAPSVGAAIHRFRKKHGTPHCGSDPKTGGFVGYSIDLDRDWRGNAIRGAA